MGRALRDTDADWRAIGATQPYWGVLTHPDYRTENLTPEHLEAFYASGAAYIDDVVGRLHRLTGAVPAGPALDFGCGVGRLTEAMAAHARPVWGYDVSPDMLRLARERGGAATYVDALPEGPFDWLNSFIVFQHIPPRRGLELMEAILGRLAPGGFVSLHVTVWREDHLIPPEPRGWRRLLAPVADPAGSIQMYDYDLGAVCRLLGRHGIDEITLVATDHGGHHGVLMLGRRGFDA